jgi:hypothetical protein
MSFGERIREGLGVTVEPMPELRRHLVEGFRFGEVDDDGLPIDRMARRGRKPGI